MEKAGFGTKAQCALEINKGMLEGIKAGGRFKFECIGPDGKLKWESESKNTVTDEGIEYLLNHIFGSATKVSQWYIGLYTATVGSFRDLTGADIGGSNLAEFTGYSGTRKLFSGVLSGAAWSNTATPGEFPITSNATIKGAFLCSDGAGTAPYLLCIDAFDAGDRTVAPADTLRVTYIFSAQTL